MYLIVILSSLICIQLISTVSSNINDASESFIQTPTISDKESDEQYDYIPRSTPFLRYGRSQPSFLRFGRSEPTFLRFGRSQPTFLRFGRNNQNGGTFLRFGKKGEFLRFG